MDTSSPDTDGPSDAASPTTLTATDIANELVGVPTSIVEFVGTTLDRICDNPTKDTMLKVTRRLFRTHGAYVQVHEEARKLRDRETVLVAQLRAYMATHDGLKHENALLRSALGQLGGLLRRGRSGGKKRRT